MRWKFLVSAGVLGALPGAVVAPSCSLAHEAGHDMTHEAMRSASGVDAPASCESASIAQANAATPVFAANGRLWLAWTANGCVLVAPSDDLGRTFASPVTIAKPGKAMDAGADARPQIVIDGGGRIVVSYAYFVDDKWNARTMVATSIDAGRSFSTPTPLAPGVDGQRFAVLLPGKGDRLFAAWVQKRGKGATIAYANSTDGGMHFDAFNIAASGSCECCRIAVAADRNGLPLVAFRNIFPGGVRDHAVLRFEAPDSPAPIARIAVDDWKIDSCPHHGPALAVAADGSYHVAWFTQGDRAKGLFYARSTDRGEHFSTPRAIGSPERHPGRPALLAVGDALWLAWKEFDGESTSVLVQQSQDGGQHWTPPEAVAHTIGYSDHPLLIARGDRAYLSWLTRRDGLRLTALPSP